MDQSDTPTESHHLHYYGMFSEGQIPHGYRSYCLKATSMPVIALLLIFKDMRPEILKMFLAKTVRFDGPVPNMSWEIGLIFLQMLSTEEIAENIKDIAVEWSYRRFDDIRYNQQAIFDILAKSSRLRSLRIEAEFDKADLNWDLQETGSRSFHIRENSAHPTGWEKILKFRDCGRMRLIHTRPVYFHCAFNHMYFALYESLNDYMEEMQDLVNRTCSQTGTDRRITEGEWFVKRSTKFSMLPSLGLWDS
jgi:hypothetical protein